MSPDHYPPGYIPPVDLAGAMFAKPAELPYRKIIKCKKCGMNFLLETPYEKCNPEIRDLCGECIFDYHQKNPVKYRGDDDE